jgi:hypothetical protein
VVLTTRTHTQPDPAAALPYLHQAAARATLQCPQPAYVLALILLGAFFCVSVSCF